MLRRGRSAAGRETSRATAAAEQAAAGRQANSRRSFISFLRRGKQAKDPADAASSGKTNPADTKTLADYYGEPVQWPYEVAAAVILKHIATCTVPQARADYTLMLAEVRHHQGKKDEAVSLCIRLVEDDVESGTSRRAKDLLKELIRSNCNPE